jgi:hypothetical protein
MDAYAWAVFTDTGVQLAVGITDDRDRARGHVEHLLVTEPSAAIGTEQRAIKAIRVIDAVAAWPIVGQTFVCQSDTADPGFRWSALSTAILRNKTNEIP